MIRDAYHKGYHVHENNFDYACELDEEVEDKAIREELIYEYYDDEDEVDRGVLWGSTEGIYCPTMSFEAMPMTRRRKWTPLLLRRQ